MTGSGVADNEKSLGEIVRTIRDVLRRRYLMLAAVTLAVTSAGVSLTSRMTPTYRSVVKIQIDPSRNPLARNQSEANAQLADEAIETEVANLGSMDLARHIVRRLDLINHPQFRGVWQAYTGEGGPMRDIDKVDMVAAVVHEDMDVSRDRLTYLLLVAYSSPDPDLAATVANAVATDYINGKVDTRIALAERQSRWFESRMVDAIRDVRMADERVARYQAQAGIVRGAAGGPGTMADQQVAPLSVQLAHAESMAAEARSKQASAQRQLVLNALDTVSDVRNSATVQDLRRQRAVLLQARAAMDGRYGERHPDYLKVQDQLQEVDQQLKEEANRIVSSLHADADAANARAASLRSSIHALEAQQTNNARALVVAASLQRDADNKRMAYDRLSQLVIENRQAAQNSIAQSRIVEEAQPPRLPNWPNRPLLFITSVLVGLGVGIATIFAQELLSSGLRTAQAVEGKLGVPLLAAIPNAGNIARPANLSVERPMSPFAETLRNARASIIGVHGRGRPRIIAIISAVQAEGKTTTALGLAQTMAVSGDRTILIDTDLRNASLRDLLDANDTGPGIVELLCSDALLEEAIRPSSIERLDHILSSNSYVNSVDIFGNGRMKTLLDTLGERYDAIILDLPSLIESADGRVLAALADAVVMVIRWDATPAEAVISATDLLKSDGTNLVGAILTMVGQTSVPKGRAHYSRRPASAYQTV